MKRVKKVLNIEYDLDSVDFIAQKQDEISSKFQAKYEDNIICKVTTFCVPDKAIVVSTTQENVNFMGAASKMLAQRPLQDQSILTLDDEMLKTFEITITAGTDLPDYVTAINVAQAKADKMFEEDDSKIPLVTVIDYRWGNSPATVSASIFGGLLNSQDPTSEVVIGDVEEGIAYLNNPIKFNEATGGDNESFNKWIGRDDNKNDVYISGSNQHFYVNRFTTDFTVNDDTENGSVFSLFVKLSNGEILELEAGRSYDRDSTGCSLWGDPSTYKYKGKKYSGDLDDLDFYKKDGDIATFDGCAFLNFFNNEHAYWDKSLQISLGKGLTKTEE